MLDSSTPTWDDVSGELLPKVDYSATGFSFIHGDKIVVLDSYFDESGTHNKRALVVAGFVAPANVWADFSIEWQRVLDAHHLKYFHMTEFRSDKARRYQHLSVTQRVELLDSLVCLIRNLSGAIAVACIISPKEYEQITTGKFRSKLGTSYTLCAYACVGVALHESGKVYKDGTRLGVFLERGHKNTGQAIKFIEELKDDLEPIDTSGYDGAVLYCKDDKSISSSLLEDPHRERGVKIGAIGRGSKTAMPPLQAADLLAYCIYLAAIDKDLIFSFAILGARISTIACPNTAMYSRLLRRAVVLLLRSAFICRPNSVRP